MRVYTKINILNSLFWIFLKNFATIFIQLVLQIVMARLLMPEDYGLIAIVLVFINISVILSQSGLNYALIQKRNPSVHDYSTVFTVSLIIATLLYSILFILAPFIAGMYGNSEITLVLRVFSITLFIGPFLSVQNAYIAKNALFKVQFISGLIAIIISGIIGLIMAINGFGVWSLVTQYIMNSLLISVLLLIFISWKPKLYISLNNFKDMIKFSYKLLIVAIVSEFYNDLRTLIIGKKYTSATLGTYDRGFSIPRTIIKPVNNTIRTLMFPTLSEYNNNPAEMKKILRRSIKTSMLLVFPMMVGLALVAHPLVLLLLTDKWIGAVIFIQIFSLLFSIEPIHSLNRQAIIAIGKSNLSLFIEIIRKIVGIAILIISLKYGVVYIALGALIDGFVGLFITTYPTGKYLNYKLSEQIKDIFKVLIATLVMSISVILVNFLNLDSLLTLLIQSCIGVLTYFLSIKLLKYEAIYYVINEVKNYILRKSEKNDF